MIFWWIIGIIIFNLIFGFLTFNIFKKANQKSYLSFIPILNSFISLKIINRPIYWILLFYIPIVGPVMWIILMYRLSKCFKNVSNIDSILVIITFGIYLLKINFSSKVKYIKPSKKYKNNFISSLIYAIILSTIIHNYIVQPMIVPTGSMEGTIKIGDALFVEKLSFGPRINITPIGLPFSDFINKHAYIDKIRLPYFRIKGWRTIKHNDIIVFNYPNDSIFDPIDRKDCYVKRLVGMPGDSLKINNGLLYINNQLFKHKLDAKILSSYIISSNKLFDRYYLYKKYKILDDNYKIFYDEKNKKYIYYFMGINNSDINYIAKKYDADIKKIIYNKDYKMQRLYNNGHIDTANTIFPIDKNWNVDNYGPIYIPKKGDILYLNKYNINMYLEIIKKYENNKVNIYKKNGIHNYIINGKKTNKYKIKQNYYFMMGDNRHQSLDSRFFGFVGEDHIIGRPFMVWANANGCFINNPYEKFIFPRFFTILNDGNNNKKSYTKYVLIFLIIWILCDIWTYIQKNILKYKKK